MKLFKIIMLFLVAAFTTSGVAGQANAFINVLTQNSGQVSLGGTVFIQVDVGNTGPVSDIGVNKVRAQISIPIAIATALPNAQQTGLPAGWIITSNTGSAITVCNGSDVIAVGTQRTILIAVQGTALGGPSTVTGVLSFGPGTGVCTGPGSLPGDNTADNTSTSSIQVIPAPACSLAVTASAGTIACNGGTTTLTATATGANGAVQYSLNGGTFQSGNTFTVNAAGSPYTVTAREAANTTCTATAAAVTVTQPAALTATATSTPVTIIGGNNGTATAVPAGGTSPYTYSWNIIPVQTTVTATGLTAGSYTVTVTDAGGCTATATTTVGSPVCNLSATASAGLIACFGGTTTLTVTATGGTVPLQYSLNGGAFQSANTFTVNAAGSPYIVTVKDAGNCTATTAAVTVTQPAAITASASAGVIACNGGTTTLTVTATGGTAPLQYSLNGGAFQSANTFTVNAAGSPYTVTVKDASNCTVTTAAVTVTQPAAITASASAGVIACNGGTTTLTVTATGGTAPLQYSLNGGAFQSANTFTVNAAGSPYTVTVKDASNCTVTTAAVTVTQPTVLAATATSTPVTTQGGSNGTATAVPAGGTSPYTYSWNTTPVQTTVTATGLTAGSYTVTVTDAGGCTTTATTTVGSPACNLSATAVSGTPIACNGGTTTLTVTATGGNGALLYSLNGGTFQSGNIFTVGAGTYTVSVKDASNCTATTASVTVTQPTAVVVSVNAPAIPLPGGTTTVTVGATGGTSPYTGTGTFTNISAGTYNYTVTDSKGCTGIAFITLADPVAGDANAFINVLTLNSGQVNQGQTVDVQVSVGNTGPSFIGQNKVRAQISIPIAIATALPNAQQTGLPAGWTIVSNTGGVITVCNGTDFIPAGIQRQILIKVQGTAAGGPSTIAGVLSFGPGTGVCTGPGSLPGDLTSDNTSTSTIQVIPVSSCNLSASASSGTITCTGGTTTLTATVTGASGAVEYSLNGGAFQSGNTFTVGAGSYTVTVRETANPTCTVTTNTVTVIITPDTIKPTITAPAGVTVCTNSGCTATGVLLGTPVTADNCTVASVTNNAPASFPLGSTTVIWTVTDGSGNTTTAAQTVIVNDCTAPAIYINQSGLQPGITGPSSSASPYLLPMKNGVRFRSILTAADAIGGYQMVGVPDGLGAFDNNDGTFTLLMNHELGNTAGGVRAHGAIGAFVSKWVINKSTLQVLSGSDLMQQVYNWNATTQSSNTTTSTFAFNRFCSADLPLVSAFYNGATGLGTKARIYMHGEEGGATGYQLGTVANGPDAGKAYILGKFNLTTNGSGLTGVGAWENALANPFAQNKTIVIGNNDGGTGIMLNSVSVYVGTKTNTGTEVDKAGLTNGTLSFVNVTGNPAEIVNTTTRATNITSGTPFTLSGTSATTFSRPEDGAWNPADPKQYFFVTTDQYDQVSDGIGAQTGRSRLWRLNFTDITNPASGGTIDLLLNGTEGHNMLDNMSADKFGHLIFVEDVGNQQHNGKVWQYTIATGQFVKIGKHDPARFGDVGQPATSPYNQDEEASGVIDVSDILGNGMHLLVDQAHYTTGIPSNIVEGGQLLAMFNPESVGATSTAQDTIRVCSGTGVNLGTPATSDNCSVASVTNNAPSVFPAGTTTVTWTVTDGSGNTATATQVVIVSTLAATATSTAVTTTGGNDGTATVTATGGTAPYTYSWNTTPVQTTATATGLTAGTYIVTVTDAAGCSRTATVTVANSGNGKVIPGRIEAESFDAKQGVQYATATTDAGGGQHVAGLTNGSWLDYNVTVLQSGTYTVNFRVATTQSNAQLQVKLGAAVLGTVSIPNTGGWDIWQTVALNNVALTAGVKTIRIQLNSNESCNFNWTDWTLTATSTAPTANAGSPQIITLPTNQVTLTGSGTANNGGSITGYAWTQVGGTAATITSPSSASTTVTGLTTPGVRTFRLTVTQNDLQTAFSEVTVTVNLASGKVIPGRIEAESFDAKQGVQYATATTDAGGGQHVAGLTNGSWLDYNVTVLQSGTYTVNFRVATTQSNAQLQVKLGAAVLGTVSIPNTGGWDIWQTVALNNIPLTAGPKTIRIQLNSNESCNFNWTDWTLTATSTAPTANAGSPQIITLPTNQVTLTGSGTANNGGSITGYAWTQVGGTAATITSPSSASTTVTGLTTPGVRTFRLTVTQNDLQTAFSEVTVTVNLASGKVIPGRIEAESFDAKQGVQYATATTDAGGGQHVAGLTNGSWLDYNVTVLQSGTYTVNFRVATTQSNAQLQVKLGAAVLGTVSIPNTGGWDVWQTVALNNVSLTAGVQTIRIQLSSNETCNFNWTDWLLATPPVAPLTIAAAKQPADTESKSISLQAFIFPNPTASYFNLKVQAKSMEEVTVRILDIAGRQVQQLKGNHGQTLRFGDNMVKGTYFIEVSQGAEKVVMKVIKQ